MRKILLRAGVMALALLSLGACTPAQEQAVETGVNAACIGVTAGAALTVQVSSSISGVAPWQQTLTQTSSTVCSGLIAALNAEVSYINSQGGTATVTAATTSAAAAVALREAVGLPAGERKVGAATVLTWTVPPAQKVFGIF